MPWELNLEHYSQVKSSMYSVVLIVIKSKLPLELHSFPERELRLGKSLLCVKDAAALGSIIRILYA